MSIVKLNLKNGFGYIKELLLQYHGFKIYSDYHKLMDNNIKVYSVKSDAFVIAQKDVEQAQTIIDFHN